MNVRYCNRLSAGMLSGLTTLLSGLSILLIGVLPSQAAITLVGATGAPATRDVPSHHEQLDSSALNPNPLVRVGGMPAGAQRNNLQAQFTAANGFGFSFNPGGTVLNGTLRVSRYEATAPGTHTGGAGLIFWYERAATDPPLANLRFVQMVETNAPTGGAASPYNDPARGSRYHDNRPFYYTNAEIAQNHWTGDAAKTLRDPNRGANGAMYFEDFPRRSCRNHPDAITWRGHLYLSADHGNGDIRVYDGITWGFDLACHGVAPPPPPPIPAPRPVPPARSFWRGFFQGLAPGIAPLFSMSTPDGTVGVELSSLVLTNVTEPLVFTSGANEMMEHSLAMSGLVNLPEFHLRDVPVFGDGFALIRAAEKAGSEVGTWSTEIVALQLTGTVATPFGDLGFVLRTSSDPFRASGGELSVDEILNFDRAEEVLPPGSNQGYHVSSSLDVFFELSVNGSPFAPNLRGVTQLHLVPEPSSWLLATLAIVGGAIFGRRRSQR